MQVVDFEQTRGLEGRKTAGHAVEGTQLEVGRTGTTTMTGRGDPAGPKLVEGAARATDHNKCGVVTAVGKRKEPPASTLLSVYLTYARCSQW